MKNLAKISNPYNEDKVIAACSIFGVMNVSGKAFSGELITTAIGNMKCRSNGLGGGFAVYGIYPEHQDHYAFHLMFLTKKGKEETDLFLNQRFKVTHAEEIPTKKTKGITDPPLVWRYFIKPPDHSLGKPAEEDYIVKNVMFINTQIDRAFVFSSGKNMGVFKGVGYPEDISHYFRLDEYKGYLWTAHGRFPTNTQGWWGGAHPFSILDWTVVHNGEISSYGINRRYLEMFGYHCTMHTDTEIVAYAVDLLMRKHKLPIEIVADIFAAPLWSEIEHLPPEEKELKIKLRQVYSSLLLNGPFTVIIAHNGEMIGLTDRIRLRPLTAAIKGEMLYLSSEEAAIRLIEPDLDKTWIPKGGEPIVGRLKTKSKEKVKLEKVVI